MNLQTLMFLILASVVFFILFRMKKSARTTKIGLLFNGENKNMAGNGITTGAGTGVIGGSNVIVTVEPLLTSGAQNFSAVVTAVTYTVADTTIASFTNDATSLTLTPLAVGSTAITATATITDSDGVVDTLSAAGTLTVTEDTSGIRTASIVLQFS